MIEPRLPGGIEFAVAAERIGVDSLWLPEVWGYDALTGLAFIPFMFVLMRRRVLAERATMQLAANAAVTEAGQVRVAPPEAVAAFDAYEEEIAQTTYASPRTSNA